VAIALVRGMYVFLTMVIVVIFLLSTTEWAVQLWARWRRSTTVRLRGNDDQWFAPRRASTNCFFCRRLRERGDSVSLVCRKPLDSRLRGNDGQLGYGLRGM